MMSAALIAALALGFDWLLSEPNKWHPLVGFGNLADRVEQSLNKQKLSERHKKFRGVIALALAVVPLTALAASTQLLPHSIKFPLDILLLELALGHKSLHDHVRPIATALLADDEEQARSLTGRIVSRDPETLDIAKAASESVLENGNDSVFATLFWFFVAGAAGAVFFRLVNTLDAMWGYRTKRFNSFGWAAARLDDVLNFIPARLTALSYALLSPLVRSKKGDKKTGALQSMKTAFRCWREQGPLHDSPNAGPVMAAGAGALGISLGGPARYDGEWHQRPVLGQGPSPDGHDILRALKLVSWSVILWLGTYLVLALAIKGAAHA